jgi:hypothetical protein
MEELGMGRATDYVFRIIYPGHRHEHSECPKFPPWRRKEMLRRWGITPSLRRAAGRFHWAGQVKIRVLLLSLPARPFTQESFLGKLTSLLVSCLPHLFTQRLFAQQTWASLYKILLVIFSCPAPEKKKVEGLEIEGREPFSACHPTSTMWPGHRLYISFGTMQIVH